MSTTKFQKLETRDNIKRQLTDMDEAKANPVAWEKIANKPVFEKRRGMLEKQLTNITPPDTSGDEKKEIKQRLEKLEEAMVKGNAHVPPMPTELQMEKCPTGAVDQHMQWEKAWKRYTLSEGGDAMVKVDEKAGKRGAIQEWKDLRRVYGKEMEEESPNLANIDIIRPRGDTTSLSDYRIGRSYGFTALAKDNYPLAFPDHEPTSVEAKIEKPRCSGTNKDGSPCKSYPVKGGESCRKHSMEA